jgi:hypothetical protein
MLFTRPFGDPSAGWDQIAFIVDDGTYKILGGGNERVQTSPQRSRWVEGAHWGGASTANPACDTSIFGQFASCTHLQSGSCPV